MHTLMVLIGGFVLLFFCQLLARVFAGAGVQSLAKAELLFIPLWFVITAVNLWMSITQEGYSFAQELPIFVLVFGVPAAAALLTWWRLTHMNKQK